MLPYKNLPNPSFTKLSYKLESQEIDVGFMRNGFKEDYEYLNQIENNHITKDLSEIRSCLQNMESEDPTVQLFAVNAFYLLIIQSPFQVIDNMTINHFYALLQFMLYNQTQKYVLESLCYLIQAIKNTPRCINILLEFNFFSHLSKILTETREIEVINLCLFIATHSLNLGIEAQNAIVANKIFEIARSYDIEELETNILITRFFENAFSIQDLNFIDIIFTNENINFLKNLAFYGKEYIIRYYGLNGLFNLFQNFSIKTMILSADCSIYILSENLLNKNEEIRMLSSQILLQCINEPNFPLLKFYEYNVIKSMFCVFQWSDEKLSIQCIEIIKKIIYKANDQFIQQIINEIINTDLFTNVEPLSFTVKYKLTSLFEALIKKLNSSQVNILMNEKILGFLFDFISNGQIKVINIISSIFINALDINPADDFTNQLLNIFHQNSILSILENEICDEETNAQEIAYITELINRIKQHEEFLE